MATHVSFRNRHTGEIKSVKVGWSWVLFFFGPVFGIPFWMRKVYTYGALVVGWNISCGIASEIGGLDTVAMVGGVVLAVLLGLRGNQLTAKYYVENGWELAEPEDQASIEAMEKWALA